MKRGNIKSMAQHAIYASNSAQSRGRMFGVGQSPTRSEFQRDRDRIIHSTAFRRLQHKTQVFLHHEGKHFRTRLTHTLEVSQITRSIARALRVDEDLAEAIALAHDLGHTPFGHAGERVLNEKMQNFGGFDHNLQALRNVTMLENRYGGHDGLNLTWETLEGILKHNGPVKNIKSNQMPDIFDLEADTFASLEAQIAAIADDIAYDCHDIDDALRAGIINIEQLTHVPLVGEIAKQVQRLFPDIEPSRKAHEVQRRLITLLIEDVIFTTQKNIKKLNPKNVIDIRQSKKTLVCFSDEIAKTEKQLKKFLFENVYRSKQVMKNVKEGQKIIAKTFDHLFENAGLPHDWQKKYNLAANKIQKARVVCDFIAGMTDPYAIDLYNSQFDAKLDFS
jgi:dGTPase